MCRSHSNGDRSTHCNAGPTALPQPVFWYATDCSHLPIGKRVYHVGGICAGHIPTEIGRLTAMQYLYIDKNRLSGAPLTAHICRLVNECTT